MKLFLDENMPRSITKELLELGFETQHTTEVGLLGATCKFLCHEKLYTVKGSLCF